MKVYTSRTGVCAADDADAPHGQHFTFPSDTPMEDVLSSIQRSGYLPNIAGGHATWSVASNVPIAVLAQEWSEPKMLFHAPQQLDLAEGTLRLHFNYHAQHDPQTVYEVFWGLQLHAN